MVAAEPRNRSNGHVLKKDVQAPPAEAPDAAPGNGADAGEQWYSDEELARWIADGAGRDGGHSPRRRMDWRWLPYMVAVGPFLLVGLVFAAIARVLLPSRVPVWGFRRRLAAFRYLLAVGVLAGIVATAVLLVVNGWPFSSSPAADSGVGQVTAPPVQQQAQAPATTAAGAPPAAAQAPAVNTAAQAQTDAPAQQQTQAPVATAAGAPPAAAQAPRVETVAQPAADTAAQPAPTAVAETTVTTPAVQPTVVASPAPVVQPVASPAAAPAIEWVVVANSGGTGVFLRPEPVWSARWRAEPGATQREGAYPHHGNIAWREGTRLQVRGPEVAGTGPQPGSSETWVPVRDPVGREGFLPARYLQRVEATALAVPTAAAVDTPRTGNRAAVRCGGRDRWHRRVLASPGRSGRHAGQPRQVRPKNKVSGPTMAGWPGWRVQGSRCAARKSRAPVHSRAAARPGCRCGTRSVGKASCPHGMSSRPPRSNAARTRSSSGRLTERSRPDALPLLTR